MSTAFNLFSYPYAAGHRGTDTSRAAAEIIPASLLRGKVLEAFQRNGEMTADECAERLCASILSIRPRCTELRNMGKLVDTGSRRPNASGRSAIVWRVAAGGRA
jgi:predicted ArsR family transcriptional regulator